MSGKIFVGQTKLTIKADLSADITGAAVVLIKYVKPNKEVGSFVAEIENEFNGIIKYIVQLPSDIDVAGEWCMWAHVTFADGKTIAGETVSLKVHKEGKC
jgi:hypothetical protein